MYLYTYLSAYEDCLTGTQRYLTLAAAPISVLLLFLAYLSVRKENKILMYAVLATCIGAAAYFLFKVFRIYQEKSDAYRLVYKTLTVFCKSSLFFRISLLWSTREPHTKKHIVIGRTF